MEEKKDQSASEEKPQSESPETTVQSPPVISNTGTEETSTNMDPKLAALLAYVFLWVGGLIFYLIESKNKYVRFHALQSILFNVSYIVILVMLGVVSSIFGSIPGLGLIVVPLIGLLSAAIWLGFFVIWIMLMVKAYQGEKWLLPIISDIAEKNS